MSCRLFKEVLNNCKIRIEPIENADMIIFDSLYPLSNYMDYDPSKYVNRIPDLMKICYKTNFFKCLNSMKTKYPSKFSKIKDNFPVTFRLPEERNKFLDKFDDTNLWVLKSNKQNKTGISLISNTTDLDKDVPESVIQQYISPYLIDGHKFDLRVYILIVDLDPLTLYIYKEGIAYFCIEEYSTPTNENRASYSFTKIFPSSKGTFEVVRSATPIINQITEGASGEFWKQIEHISTISVLSILEMIKKSVLQACEINDKSFDSISNKIPPLKRFLNLIAIDFIINEDKTPIIIGIDDNPDLNPLNEADNKLKSELIQSEFELIESLLKKNESNNNNWTRLVSIIESPSKPAFSKSTNDIDQNKEIRKVKIHIPKIRSNKKITKSDENKEDSVSDSKDSDASPKSVPISLNMKSDILPKKSSVLDSEDSDISPKASPISLMPEKEIIRKKSSVLDSDDSDVSPKSKHFSSKKKGKTSAKKSLFLKSDDSDDSKDHVVSPKTWAASHTKKIHSTEEIDFTNFSICIKRITSPLIVEIWRSNKITTYGSDEIDKADIIIYDGIFPNTKYINFNPSKHVLKIPDLNRICCRCNFFNCLNKMKNKYPSIFENLVPVTFDLTYKINEFIEAFRSPKFRGKPWVLKANRATKAGIKLINDIDGLCIDHCIAQQYISPYLIDGHKFDLRVYILIEFICK